MSIQVVMDKKVFRVGSRESELALIQTNTVIEHLEKLYPKYQFTIVTMSTLGDQIIDKPLPKIGEKSLFTKELETALQSGVVDLVVHSLKDMPTALPDGLAIGAILEREDPRDAVLLKSKHRGMTLETLPENSIIGTSSLRRTAQLKRKYPHLVIKDIRGNLQTRLRKLEQGDYDGIILATAGVKRMGWEHHISKEDNTPSCGLTTSSELKMTIRQIWFSFLYQRMFQPVNSQLDLKNEFTPRIGSCLHDFISGTIVNKYVLEDDEMLYAVGQGALAVECRENDCKHFRPLSHDTTLLTAVAERSLLATLGGGCSAPVAVTTDNNGQEIKLTAAVWSLDGLTTIQDSLSCKLDEGSSGSTELPLYCGVSDYGFDKEKVKRSYKLGVDLATNLIEKGALKVIEEAKTTIANSI